MKNLLILIFLLSITTSTLLQVVSLIRHGARYHLSSAFDGNDTRADWGQLTSVGMRQHYNLGQLIRKQYVETLGFLRPSYNHSEFEVYSTNVDRTKCSAEAHLTGLFPQKTGQKMPGGLSESLQVPPYKYTDNIQDEFALSQGRDSIAIHVNGPIYVCSNTSTQINKNIAQQHTSIDEMNTRYAPFFNKISQIFNISANLTTINDIIDAITVDRYLNRPIPSNFTQDDYQNIIHLQNYLGFLIFVGNLSKSISTSKLNKIISVFDNRISNPQNLLKFTLLSGHDTDVFPMLLVMNFSSHTCTEELYRFNKTNQLNCQPGPQYAASVIWELHQENNNYYVKIRSNGKYMNLCERKQTRCLYSQWKERVIKNVIIDTNEFCPAPK